MTNQGTLATTGWTDWPTIRDLIGSDPCLWTDLGDPHDGAPAPDELPIGATHLWSWRTDRWIRVRFDAGKALATILTLDPEPTVGIAVTYTRTEGIAWRNHERARRCDLHVTLIRTEGPAPITFTEVHPLTPAG
jgi:hypothetical protein